MSKTVADCFSTKRALLGEIGPVNDTTETEKFCRIFNKWFDCFNTRSLEEGQKKEMKIWKPIIVVMTKE